MGTIIILSAEKRLGGGVIRRVAAILAMVAVLGVSLPAARAQCTLGGTPSSWNVASGNWSVAANWSPSGVPNSSSTNVCITNGTSGTPSTLTLNTSPSVDNLQLGSYDTLNFSLGQTLTVSGTQIINAGQINVNGGNVSNTYLDLGSSVTLSGGNTVTLSTATGGGNAFLNQTGAYTLTNSNNTIQGEGSIGLDGGTLNNQAGGTINANSSGSGVINTLTISTGSTTNAGLMEATNNGVLVVAQSAINNNGGTISSTGAGASVEIEGTTIQGGTLGGTLVALTANSTLDGSTQGTLTLLPGATYTTSSSLTTRVLGIINNQGNLQLNGGGGSTPILQMTANTTLEGGGTVTLNTSTASGGGNATLEPSNSSITLTNVNNTIQGEGMINLNTGGTLINQSGATINANSTGSGVTTTLELTSGNVTNGGTLEAVNNGVLQLNSDTINNNGGSITSTGAGASVQVDNSTIQGGTLSGTLSTVGTSILDGSTHGTLTLGSGTYTTAAGNTTKVLGTLSNQGNFQVNGGGGSTTIWETGGNTSLQGGGTLTLSTASGTGSAVIEQAIAGTTLTNVNNTIQGNGIIGNGGGLALNNESTVNANVASGVLTLNGTGAVTNSGLMEATNGGTLVLDAITVNNAGGNITAGSGSTVQIYGGANAVIQGGTLNNNGGTLGTPSGDVAYLDGSTASGAVTINGTYTSGAGSQTHLVGTIINQGNIQLNAASASNADLSIGNSTVKSVTLEGGGTVTLTTAGTGSSYILESSASTTLVNYNDTIQGAGTIGENGLSVTNDASGTILANSSGQTLTIIGAVTVTNNGTLQANSGSTLNMNSTTSLTNFSGGTLTGGTYNVYGTSGSPGILEIGSLGSSGGEIVNNAATILLSGPNSDFYDSGAKNALSNLSDNLAAGSFTIQNGRNFITAGAFSNAGTVTVGSGSTLTLTGAYNQSGGTTQGIGTLNGAVTIGGGTFQPGLPGAPGTLSITGSYNQTGGTFSEQISGTSTFGVLNVTGGNVTLGSSADLGVTLVGGFNPVGNTYTIVNDPGGTISGTFANAPSNGQFILAGYNWTVAYSSTSIVIDAQDQVGSLITATWGTGSGAWTTPGQWSCSIGPANCVPNNDANNVFAAVLNSSGQTLTLNNSLGAIAVNNFTLTAGTLNIASGASLNVVDSGITDIPTAAGLIVDGTLTNGLSGLTSVEGLLTLANAQTTSVTPGGGTLTNSGTVNVQQGSTLAVTGALTNSGYFNTGNGVADAGGNMVTVSGQFTNNSSGSVSLAASGDKLIAGSFSNAGSVTVGSGTTLQMGSGGTGAYNQSAGTTQGSGAIAGAVTIAGGTFQPGLPSAPGTLSITGSYNQTGGTFSEQMSGVSTFAVLDVTGGNVTLGSSADLGITLVGGFNPVGNSYAIVNDAGGTVSGTFANAPSSGEFILDGINWTATYNSSGIVLDAESQVGALVTGTWSTGNGTWATASQWSCNPGPANCVPNNDANNVFAAVLNSSGHTLTLDNSLGAIAVNNLTLTAGTLNIASGASLNVLNNGLTDIPTAAGLIVAGTFTNGAQSGLAGLTNVEGSLTLANAQTTSVTPSGGTLTNSGTVNVQQGSTLAVAGALTNSGNFNTGNGVADSGSNMVTVSGPFTNSSGGSLILAGSGDNLTAGSFSNAGSVTVGSGTTLQMGSGGTNDFNQSGGSLKVNGTLAAATTTINGGMLSGSGTITGNVTNTGGTVTASDPGTPAILTITGNYTQGSGGILDAYVAGTTAGTGYSQLDAGGTATMGGTLDVYLTNGFNPTPGENFYLVESTGGVIGTFASLDLPTAPPGDSWNLAYNPNNIDLTLQVSPPTSTPEPSIFLLLVLGIAALAVLRKYRRTASA